MMKRIRAKILSLALVVVMLVGMVPTMALATDETTPEQQMSMVTNSDLIKAQEDYIYLGWYPQSLYTPQTAPESPAEDTDYTDEDGTRFVYLNGNYYKYEPIKWRVLSNDTTNKQLLLVTDQILDVTQYHTSASAVKYNASNLKTICNNIVYYNVTGRALNSILSTEVEGTNGGKYRGYALSLGEIENTSYFPDDESKKASSTAYATAQGSDGSYWLRTGSATGSVAPYVNADGSDSSAAVTSTYGVRPAMLLNADVSEISYSSYNNNLTVSSATFFGTIDSKVSGEVGQDCLKKVEPLSGHEWRVNFADVGSSSSSGFYSGVGIRYGNANGDTIQEMFAEPGKEVEFYYIRWGKSDVTVNDYISAMISNANGQVLYYGNIVQMEADGYNMSGTAKLTIPVDCPEGEYILNIFNERKFADKEFDLTSKLRNIKLTVKKDVKFDITLDPLPKEETLVSANTYSAKESEEVTLKAVSDDQYHLYSWKVVDSANNSVAVDTKVLAEDGVYTNTFSMPGSPVFATPTYTVHNYAWGTPDNQGNITGSCLECGHTLTTTKREVHLGAEVFTNPIDTNPDAELYDYKPTSYLYFGSYNYWGHGTVRPVLWRVLDAEKNVVGQDNSMFLLSEYTLQGTDACLSTDWGESPIRTLCDTIEQSAFDQMQFDAIQPITYRDEFETITIESNTGYYSGNYEAIKLLEGTGVGGVSMDYMAWEETYLDNDHLFALSVPEFYKYMANYQESANSPAPYYALPFERGDGSWILRSPLVPHVGGANWVAELISYTDTYVGTMAGETTGSRQTKMVRPAMNLDKSKILFTYGAYDNSFVNDHTSSDNTLIPMSGYSHDEWGVALLDSERNFQVNESELTVAPGELTTIHFTGAGTGTSEALYAFLTRPDDDEILYYGRIKDMSSSSATSDGFSTFRIPNTIPTGEYTLKVTSLQNGASSEYTKYASAFADIALTLDYAPVTEASTYAMEPMGKYYPDCYAAASDGEKYTTDEVEWYLYEDGTYTPLTGDDMFVAGKEYAVRIRFDAQDGYTFADDCVFKINDKEAVIIEQTETDCLTEARFIAEVNMHAWYSVLVNNGIASYYEEEPIYEAYPEDTINLIADRVPEGKRFTHWTSSSESVIFEDAEATNTTFIMPPEDVEITAVFEDITYAIEYHVYRGTLPEDAPSSYKWGNDEIILPTPTRSGFVFDGWFDNAEFEGEAITVIPADSHEDKAFYAKWLSTNTSLTAVIIDGVYGIFDLEGEGTVTVTLPYGSTLPTDVAELEIVLSDSVMTMTTPLTTDNGATWTFTVTAEDGVTERTYTIFVREDVAPLQSVVLEATSYIYNGKARTPEVTVKDINGKKLVEGTDYTVTYAKNVNEGTAIVTVTGLGAYSFTEERTFTIRPKILKAPSKVQGALYGYDDIKVTWNKVSGADGYYVYYKVSTAKSFTRKNATGTSCKLTNLADGKRYIVRVVPYYKNTAGTIRYNESVYREAQIYTLKKLSTPTVTKKNARYVTVKWMNIEGESGYQISQSTKKSSTKIVNTISTTTGKSKAIKATKGKTYYYKVRAYKKVGSSYVYGPWSSVKSYKLK